MLGVDAGATDVDLKVAYRRSALLFHPDRHPEADRPLAEGIFKEITAAYKTLSNPETRRRYDRALATGAEYRESNARDDIASLADILADIQAYQYVFSRAQLSVLDPAAVDLVNHNLIDKIGEQVVAVYPLKEAPLNAAHPGTYKTGAVVLTNLRVIMPFTYEWQETDGNVRTTYKGLSAPVVPLPLVKRLTVLSRRRLSSDVIVVLEQPDSSAAFQAGRANLAKLLLIASLWGIPLQVAAEDARKSELRATLLHPWSVVFWSGLVLLVAATVAGFFGAGGVFGAPVALASWGADVGLVPAVMLLTSFWVARGLGRWVHAYRSTELLDLLRETTSKEAGAPAWTGTVQGRGV
jgi:hypothetical protein